MKRLLVIFLTTLFSINISLAQSGWGYVNYTSYKTHAGNGSINQYTQFANNAAGFDAMFNTANSNTTITHTGETQIVNLYNGSLSVPHWSGDYFGFKFDFWFIPQQTGTYYFGINSDDASDLSMDGTIIVSYYGGHGASSWQTVPIYMTAGQRYRMVYRGQEYGGGEAFYFMWNRPGLGWGYWNNEVTNIANEPTKKARMNFDFGSTLNKTTFSVGSALSSTGWIDITNQLDSVKVANGKKATIATGQAEFSYVNISNGTTTLYIDLSRFGGVIPSSVNSVSILDVYNGPVTYQQTSAYWAHYIVPSTLPKVTDGTSIYNGSIRNAGYNNWAFMSDINFSDVLQYKQQKVTMTTTNTLSTLYNSIVTVTDVYLAFKELQNGGIFGNQSGNEFTYGIQYKNADVNDDGQFNETDSYLLLQHLMGKKNLVDTFNLKKTLKLIPQQTYSNIGKSNWSTFPTFLGDTLSFDINTGNATDTLYYSGTWKGDVNLSHSTTPPSNGITTMSANFGMKTTIIPVEFLYDTELIGDSIVVNVKINGGQELVAVQFDLNFDKLINHSITEFKNLTTTNFSKLGNGAVTIGSINTSGQILGNTEYKISFKSNTKIENILGLISISNYEGIDTNGKILKIKVL